MLQLGALGLVVMSLHALAFHHVDLDVFPRSIRRRVLLWHRCTPAALAVSTLLTVTGLALLLDQT